MSNFELDCIPCVLALCTKASVSSLCTRSPVIDGSRLCRLLEVSMSNLSELSPWGVFFVYFVRVKLA